MEDWQTKVRKAQADTERALQDSCYFRHCASVLMGVAQEALGNIELRRKLDERCELHVAEMVEPKSKFYRYQ